MPLDLPPPPKPAFMPPLPQPAVMPKRKYPRNPDNPTVKPSWPQYHFIISPAKFPAMIAGFGAGKTKAGEMRAMRLKMQYPKQNVGYYLPTYSLIKQIAYPRFEEFLIERKYKYFLNKTDHELTIVGAGKIIFRSMEEPESIIGYEHADAIVDELDVLKMEKAADIWRRIVARNRQKKPDGSVNTIGVTTTPEGYKFVYDKWQRQPLKGSQIIKASTYSNARNLPDDYIQTLRDNYPAAMLQAYLMGDFVNLTQGRVYPEFCRIKNGCFDTIKEGENLHIGVDFNVGKMAAIVHVFREPGEPRAVEEHVNLLDTPSLIAMLKARYQSEELKARHKAHKIIIYPDATGRNRKSNNAAASDLALLKQAGFLVLVKTTNPFVRDRIASFNKLIHKDGKRVYKVNVNACPHLVETLEKQAYDKNGEPDKTSGLDHVGDGAGYFVSYKYPILFGKARKTNLSGV